MSLRHSPGFLLVMGLLLAGCGTGPQDRPFRASYFAGYDPGVIVFATETCDRLVDHVVLELGDTGTFELSMNVVDDCTRAGGGFAFSEILRFGTYTRQGNALVFTTDVPESAVINGRREPNAMVLTFPEAVGSVGPTAAELRVTGNEDEPGFSRRK